MLKRVLRKVFVRISSLLGIPEIQARLDAMDRFNRDVLDTSNRVSDAAGAIANLVDRRILDLSSAINTDISERVEQLRAHQENRLTSLNEALVRHMDLKQEAIESGLATALSDQSERIQQLRQTVDTVRRRVESAPAANSAAVPASVPSAVSGPVIDDAMYVALENYFRGSRDLVAERQAAYIPHLPSVVSAATPLVDLGCGRGEWLSVLRDRGIPAIGIDSNAVCIAECAESGLSAELGDLLGFLRARPDASVGAYTLFQVLEHLPFPVLLEAMREMRRTLVPGGVLIAEVPNAKNLRVAAGTFWIDPTHQRPLYPEFLQFLAQEVGFGGSEALYVNDDSPELDLSGLPAGARIAMERVLEAIDTARDFALVATA